MLNITKVRVGQNGLFLKVCNMLYRPKGVPYTVSNCSVLSDVHSENKLK